MVEKLDDVTRGISGDLNRESDEEKVAPVTNDKKSKNSSNQCPECGGIGYLRADVGLDHPDFGKITPCVCSTEKVKASNQKQLFAMGKLEKLAHLTFGNFNPEGHVGLWPAEIESLKQAYNHAKQFSNNPTGWLFMQGRYGCGKTHLAAAIANQAVKTGISTLFLTLPDLLDFLRAAYSDSSISYTQRMERLKNAPLLIMDDFGTQNATDWVKEKLFQILNYRYINKLPTVVTTNLSVKELDERLWSRLEDPELVTRVKIIARDYRQPHTETGHHELSSLGNLSHYTFATFSLREDEKLTRNERQSLKKALDSASNYASKPHGWLVITGHYYCGKTHLAASIGNHRADIGYPPLFVSVPDLLDHLRATFSPSSQVTYDQRFEDIRNTPFLILDDLGTKVMSPWSKEKLLQIINYRYNSNLPTVITISVDYKDLDPRLRARLMDKRKVKAIRIDVSPYSGG